MSKSPVAMFIFSFLVVLVVGVGAGLLLKSINNDINLPVLISSNITTAASAGVIMAYMTKKSNKEK